MSTTVDGVLQAALNGLNLRQQVTANNIANADTPGFKAQTVQFEDQLQWAMSTASNNATLQTEAAPEINVAPGQVGKMDNNSVDMDQQLLTMTDTSMRYNAVTRILSDRIALYRSVITDGKG